MKKGGARILTDKVELGYYGIKGWTGVEVVDLSITKETAITIAEDAFTQIKGKGFVNETEIGAREVDGGKYYSVFRYKEGIYGGDLSVIIRKSDGKIMRVVAGE
jgi:hypothetical protein